MRKRIGITHNFHNHSDKELVEIGVYTITSKTNSKMYVGSASRIEGLSEAHLGFGHRWRDHVYRLLNNIHNNKHLQNHVNKYGIEDLNFEILEDCDQDGIEGRELYWINMLNTIQNGFNMCYPVPICRGVNHPRYINLDAKEVVRLYIENNMNIKELARIFNVSSTPIKRALMSENIKTYINFKKINYKKLYKEYINSWLSISELARKYNIVESTLIRGFKKNGYITKTQKVEHDLDNIYKRYLNGESIKIHLAPEYKIHHTVINRKLNNRGYKLFNKEKYGTKKEI